ncbi:hypothetical protein FJQ98_14480 [Lysinibacillus agricola]|uniref:Uncharacterized protein n=1 Tax=Lysinibacillus agricola TaxID=2590012 RepID=A0ABX7AQG6_9BACI|nr:MULTISPECIES: hypothetical protein [Lysinibacillus]KOS64689.1 hypothetical protein AN161_01325 [Lysinibacillus sp. FJAT-14222]QQP10489.1 hypothetical protein FJQ98_14480 [Lysinibacillus agricola]
MNTIKSLIFPQDLTRLNKTLLKEVCHKMTLESTGNVNDLASRVWDAFEHIEDDVFKKISNNIFSGPVSLAWYQTTNQNGLTGLKQSIIDKMPFNPFETVITPNSESVPIEPTIIAAAGIESSQAYYLRFIHRTGVNVDYFLTNRREYIKHEITTVYIDEIKGILEVRASSTVAKKIIAELAKIVDIKYEFKQYDFLEKYGGSLEPLADVLQGKLIDATGRPAGLVNTFEETQGQSIVSILSAIDEYYTNGELSVLEQNLNSEDITGILETTPFTLLLLSGLETIGLGSIRELRGLPLYNYLEPYLSKQKGSILFEHSVGGVVQEYSIRIGITTKTFKFNVFASEHVLDYIREKLI